MFTFVTALDRNFILPTSVMLCSLDKNVMSSHSVVVLTSSYDNRLIQAAFRKLKLKMLKIRFVVVPDVLQVEAIRMNGIMHFSNASIYRLFMSSLIEEDINYVIYLDGDILIRKQLSDTSFPKARFAAYVQEDSTSEMIGNHSYFNSGVFSTQLDYWRESNAEYKMLSFLENHLNSIYKDQDALNFVFSAESVYPLPKDLNFLLKESSFLKSRKDDPTIVHFAGHLKPWRRFTPPSRFINEWRKLAREINVSIYMNPHWTDYFKLIGYLLKINKVRASLRNSYAKKI